MKRLALFLLCSLFLAADIPLYWWRVNEGTTFERTNFGDELSVALIERILQRRPKRAKTTDSGKLLAIGSILQFARTGDVIWGSGINGKHPNPSDYHFTSLDIRAVRGPLTREFLQKLGVSVPPIFGEPALLLPYFFPEFEVRPTRDYIVIPNIGEMEFVKGKENVVLPTEPWQDVVQKIIESKFVVSSSLHGLIVAEAFGIPARFLRITYHEPDFKYADYYRGTGRATFQPAHSIEEALELGGEPPPQCDLNRLLDAFPFDYFE